ncbi:MAG: hypothetical protein IT215_07300 [Chitinophagaceae bacterium]|nr:hypothetical protein [Chitinophagaceae bacterium]
MRIDAVLGDIHKPTALFDLKTGSAKLTNTQISKIRSHLPAESKNIPIKEIRPSSNINSNSNAQ